MTRFTDAQDKALEDMRMALYAATATAFAEGYVAGRDAAIETVLLMTADQENFNENNSYRLGWLARGDAIRNVKL